MRHFIRFFSLMLVVSLFFWNCERETSMDTQLPEKVTSLADFDKFVQAQVILLTNYPQRQLMSLKQN